MRAPLEYFMTELLFDSKNVSPLPLYVDNAKVPSSERLFCCDVEKEESCVVAADTYTAPSSDDVSCVSQITFNTIVSTGSNSSGNASSRWESGIPHNKLASEPVLKCPKRSCERNTPVSTLKCPIRSTDNNEDEDEEDVDTTKFKSIIVDESCKQPSLQYFATEMLSRKNKRTKKRMHNKRCLKKTLDAMSRTTAGTTRKYRKQTVNDLLDAAMKDITLEDDDVVDEDWNARHQQEEIPVY